MPKITLYSDNIPVGSKGIDIVLKYPGSQSHFFYQSEAFYLIGNVSDAYVVFDETDLILKNKKDALKGIKLQSHFIFKNKVSDALHSLVVPVYKSIKDKNKEPLKMKYLSDITAGSYQPGDYSGVFTLLIKPIS